MNLNIWQRAIALGFSDCEIFGTGMTFMGSLKTTVVYKKYSILWDPRLLSQDELCTLYALILFAPELPPGDPQTNP